MASLKFKISFFSYDQLRIWNLEMTKQYCDNIKIELIKTQTMNKHNSLKLLHEKFMNIDHTIELEKKTTNT